MKMAPGFFAGILLILIGLSAIFHILFHVNLFGILFSFFLIFAGIYIVTGRTWFFKRNKDSHSAFFEESSIILQPRDHEEFNVLFGRMIYDLRGIRFEDNEPIRIKINTVFGNTILLVRKDSPVKIKSDAVFAGASMPDGNSVAFGSIQYKTESFGAALNHLIIDAPVVFGALQVKEI